MAGRATFNAAITQLEAAAGPSNLAALEQIRTTGNAQFDQQLASCPSAGG
jgi:hypothetical protein